MSQFTSHRILVALDGSEHGALVLQAAIAIAKSQQAKLILFRAIGIPAGIPLEVWKTGSADLTDYLRTHARDYLTVCAASVPGELLDQRGVVVEIGSPWQAICAAAEHADADLVVVGSHGYGGIDRVIGTTAAKVVNHSKCSVLVVRPKA
jgi:universal stress protein F